WRSGKYTQDRRALKTYTGYCCLGVLCEVLGHEAYYTGNHYTYNGEKSVLSDSIKNEAGMASYNGVWRDTKQCLTSMNDGGKSFFDIADIIEQNWKEL